MTEDMQVSSPSPVMVNQLHLSSIQRDSIVDTLTPNDICSMFDEFLTEFERMEKSNGTTTQIFLDAVEEITNAVLGILPYKLLDVKVFAHPLLRFLNQMLLDLLSNWHSTAARLNIQESDIFLKIVLVFARATDHASAVNSNEQRQLVVDLLSKKTLQDLLREQINYVALNKNGMNDDPNICTLGLVTVKFFEEHSFYYSIERNLYLKDTLIYNCLDSYDYMQALRQLQNGEPLNDIEKFLLYICWEYIPFKTQTTEKSIKPMYPTNFINQFYHDILNRFKHILNETSSTKPAALTYIVQKYQKILIVPNLPSFDKHANDIIDCLIKIFDKPSSQNPDDEASISVALEAFHSLSTHSDIRPIIKKRNLTSLFNKYTSDEPGEKQKYAFAILAEIMDEKDININPSEITKAFIDQLKQLDPNRYNPELDKPLSSLNTLIQSEQIKNEFVKQGGLQTLSAFVRDSDSDIQSEKQLEDAINILWSCTFNNSEASNTLKQDEKLMTRVNDILEKSKTNQNSTLEKAAEGLIWKVEKEEKFLEERAAQSEKKKKEKKKKAAETGVEEDDEDEEEAPEYDLMISYCWAEMDLAHRIFAHLTEKLGYRIWIDKEQMHGSTIEAMANAVDGAEFILMCMSESYKRSANCKSEAEYAFNRKKHIVPIKMKKDYVPDGWLGFILGTRLYIDFGTYEFEQAIKLLDNEIQLQKKKRKNRKEVARVEREHEVIETENKDADNVTVAPQKSKQKSTCNMENVSAWSEQDVRKYLMKHNLSAVVPLCNGVSGEEFYDLYSMCKINSTSMYRSLKYELLHGYNRILPIAVYLHFMSRMRSLFGNGVLSYTDDSSEDV